MCVVTGILRIFFLFTPLGYTNLFKLTQEFVLAVGVVAHTSFSLWPGHLHPFLYIFITNLYSYHECCSPCLCDVFDSAMQTHLSITAFTRLTLWICTIYRLLASFILLFIYLVLYFTFYCVQSLHVLVVLLLRTVSRTRSRILYSQLAKTSMQASRQSS
jgi:hypothetical protein